MAAEGTAPSGSIWMGWRSGHLCRNLRRAASSSTDLRKRAEDGGETVEKWYCRSVLVYLSRQSETDAVLSRSSLLPGPQPNPQRVFC